MEDIDIYRRLDEKTAKLEAAVKEAASDRVWVNRVGSLMSIFFTQENVHDYESAVSSDKKKYADYFGYLLEHGIYVAPSQFEAMFVSDAHSREDIAATCEVMGQYFRQVL